MHLLGVDYGTKRIGLAWADDTLGVVLPFGVIESNGFKAVRELAELIQKEHAHQVVVGFPVGLQAEENKNTERVKQFVFELQKHADVPVAYFDERFSSQAGDAMGGGVSRDEKAAMVILEGFLARSKS